MNSFNPKAMTTCLTETQIQDKIFLRQTASPTETVRYLANLTKVITHFHANNHIQLRVLNNPTHASISLRKTLSKNNCVYAISLSSFNKLLQKTNFTIGDIWSRSLCCIKGVSKDKASQITKQYPTFSLFLSNLKETSVDDAALILMENSGYGPRKIGKALAKKIVECFNPVMG
jgi:crossover junction endonuclease MUS81